MYHNSPNISQFSQFQFFFTILPFFYNSPISVSSRRLRGEIPPPKKKNFKFPPPQTQQTTMLCSGVNGTIIRPLSLNLKFPSKVKGSGWNTAPQYLQLMFYTHPSTLNRGYELYYYGMPRREGMNYGWEGNIRVSRGGREGRIYIEEWSKNYRESGKMKFDRIHRFLSLFNVSNRSLTWKIFKYMSDPIVLTVCSTDDSREASSFNWRPTPKTGDAKMISTRATKVREAGQSVGYSRVSASSTVVRWLAVGHFGRSRDRVVVCEAAIYETKSGYIHIDRSRRSTRSVSVELTGGHNYIIGRWLLTEFRRK